MNQLNVRGREAWLGSRAAAGMAVLCVAALALLASGCRSSKRVEPVAARFYLEAAPGEVSVPVVLPRSGSRIFVGSKPVFTEYDVTNAELAQVELGRCLLFEFTPTAAQALSRLSAAHQGRRLVLLLDGDPVGARPIDEPLSNGSLLVFIERSDAALPGLVERLKRSAESLRQDAAKRS
jgi:hypothetical protein